ncbi:MAG: branched-chain amino acid ABC transporter substrate-binding protein [Actinomycetota bacterium]|nr:branched-chain amino acid ABC transporter substrate-binding protein [Actinomycetota bacterium]
MFKSFAAIILACSACALTACAQDTDDPTSRTLTIYVSAPMTGGRGGEDTARAVEIAVENQGGRVDDAAIEVIALNDADPDGAFSPRLVRRNALRAAADESTIAYIGEFDSGGTEIAMPILNEAGILHISSSSTAIRLTEPGPELGEILRPTGVSTFGRVIPNDTVQAGALVHFMNEESVHRVFVVDDGGTYGTGLRHLFKRLAPKNGIEVVDGPTITPSTDLSRMSDRATASGAGALFFAGAELEPAYDVFSTLHYSNIHMKLFGGDGLALSGFLESLGPIELDTFVTAPMLPAGNYAQSGEEFLETFHEKFDRDAEPISVFGYEAGHVAVDSLRSGARGNIATEPIRNLRKTTRDAFFDTTERASPLGSYSIDLNGDTTLSFYGAYRVEEGELVLGRTIDVPTSTLQELDR